MIILSQTDSEKTRNPSVALAFINKQMARVYLKAAGALIWAFADGTHLRYFLFWLEIGESMHLTLGRELSCPALLQPVVPNPNLVF